MAHFLFIYFSLSLPLSPTTPRNVPRSGASPMHCPTSSRPRAYMFFLARSQPFLLTTPRATPRSQACSRSVSVHFHALARRPLSPPPIGTEPGSTGERRSASRCGREEGAFAAASDDDACSADDFPGERVCSASSSSSSARCSRAAGEPGHRKLGDNGRKRLSPTIHCKTNFLRRRTCKAGWRAFTEAFLPSARARKRWFTKRRSRPQGSEKWTSAEASERDTWCSSVFGRAYAG